MSRFAGIFAHLAFWLAGLTSCTQGQDRSDLNRQAQRLFQTAARALSEDRPKDVRSASLEVAEMLPDDVRVQQRAAELLYLSGHVADSLPLFDKAVSLDKTKLAHNWQRGIALATAGQFKEAAQQFKVHHDVNPDDVENSAWYFLCVAKTEGLEAARKTVIPSRGDRREPMMSILEMLQDKIEPAEVERRAKEIPIQDPVNGSLARFYGDLYIALYHDALGQSQSARQYLKRSLSYGVEGYMSQTAKVYLQHRFKNSESSESKANP